MPAIMGKVYQMINLYNGDPYTNNLTEATKGPYTAEFIQAINQDIKELDQHFT